jgi:hypothetical protein
MNWDPNNPFYDDDTWTEEEEEVLRQKAAGATGHHYDKELLRFISADTFQIEGKGTVFSIKESWAGEGDAYSPRSLIGTKVNIDGVARKIKNVETFLVTCSRERPYRQPFSVLIE